MRCLIRAVIATSILCSSATVWANGGIVPPNPLPPLAVPGVRSVDVRDTNGSLARFTSIPSASLFRSYGGTSQPCSFTSLYGGIASNGVAYQPGQVVESMRWLFVEGDLVAVGEPNLASPATTSNGPLSQAVRHFAVFCDSFANFVGLVDVPVSDPLLNPRWALTNLYNQLQLERPTVYRNPVVARWGGLVTRYPAWLAVLPSAWRTQRSNPSYWRGWTMYLVAVPSSLSFTVRFTPDPARPSRPFNGTVDCVPAGTTPHGSTTALPAMPALPAQSTPGVNGRCRWTPPGPGSVTIQARIRYRVTFWANGYTEPERDYVWSSVPTTFRVGELSAVNT
jgi:hypothetical protein